MPAASFGVASRSSHVMVTVLSHLLSCTGVMQPDYAISSSAYLAIIFLRPWEMKLTVSLRSSPEPSVRRIVPYPYLACFTRVPRLHVPAGLFLASAGRYVDLVSPPPKTFVTASTVL